MSKVPVPVAPSGVGGIAAGDGDPGVAGLGRAGVDEATDLGVDAVRADEHVAGGVVTVGEDCGDALSGAFCCGEALAVGDRDASAGGLGGQPPGEGSAG
jgi:hypothetical protein